METIRVAFLNETEIRTEAIYGWMRKWNAETDLKAMQLIFRDKTELVVGIDWMGEEKQLEIKSLEIRRGDEGSVLLERTPTGMDWGSKTIIDYDDELDMIRMTVYSIPQRSLGELDPNGLFALDLMPAKSVGWNVVRIEISSFGVELEFPETANDFGLVFCPRQGQESDPSQTWAWIKALRSFCVEGVVCCDIMIPKGQGGAESNLSQLQLIRD